MGASFSRGPKTGPMYVPDPRRPPHLFVLRTPEVVLAALAVAVSYFLLLTGTGSDRLNGYNGLWQTFNRKSRVRLQSREAELQSEPPTPISADMVLVLVCIMACNSFLNACAGVFIKEQRRLETEEEEQFLKAVENPDTRAEALAKKADVLAERIKIWEENDRRRAAKQKLKRERIVQVDVMADEALTTIIVAVSVVFALLTGYFVQMQRPNTIRGCGACGMLCVLVGGLVVCSTDRYLFGLRQYCNYVNLICIACMLVLFARATLLAV